jgi:uncharacterized protein involved in outer membrane biogenesis
VERSPGQNHCANGGITAQAYRQLTSNTLNIVDLAPTLGHPAKKSESLAASGVGRKNSSARHLRAKQEGGGRQSDSDPKLDAILLPDADLQGIGYAALDGASFIIPGGEINAALAELIGINVTCGLGLLLAKNETKTSIRCAVVDFQAQKGDLAGKTLFIDTTEVLITGRGDIHLNTEALNVAFQGNPKKLPVTRVGAPIMVRGTLAHPAVGINAGKLVEQGAIATALGTVLTPVAAVIALIDGGHAKNEDCVASVSYASESIHN